MPSQPASSRLMRFVVAASALLVLAGLAAFWYASTLARKTPGHDAHVVRVVINDKTCTPNDITVPAGRTTFEIVNQSKRVLEWEILDGVMVLEERENIAPGFSQRMTARLSPGQFDITCGLLSNPRGTLVVTPSDTSRAEAAHPPLVRYIGALAEYKTYLVLRAGDLETAVTKLAGAIKDNDLGQAQALYAPAHQAYKRLEPMAALFSDLDVRINAHARYFEKREADPAFTGFHRIEHGLFGQQSVNGLAASAGQLQADVGTLKQRLRTQALQPGQLAGSAAKLLQREADNLSSAAQDSDTLDTASSLQGVADGTRKIAGLLAPLLEKSSPSLQKDIDRHFNELEAALAPYRDGPDFKPGVLTDAQRKALAVPIAALHDDFDKVNPALGLQ